MKQLVTTLAILITFATQAQQQLKPTATEALVKVTVSTKQGVAQIGEKIEFTSMKDGSKQIHVSDSIGKFDVLLPKGEKYKVVILTFGEGDSPSLFTVPSAEGMVVLNYTIYTSTINTFLLDIQFETNKATLQPTSNMALDEFYKLLDTKKDMKVEIGGHTDNVGDDKANQTLSEQRAKAVKDYLVQKGIVATRISVKGYGETVPVETNDTPEGRQKNRRTEVKIIQE